MTSVLFATERLEARRLTLDHVPSMLAIYGDMETVTYVGDGEPLTQPECERWIEVTDRNFATRGYGMVGLFDKDSGELVGCAGVVHPGQQPEPEVKYAFRRDQWGKGLASEALQGILDFFRSLGRDDEVIATVAPGNAASQRVLTKQGFVLREVRQNEDGSETQVWSLSGLNPA